MKPQDHAQFILSVWQEDPEGLTASKLVDIAMDPSCPIHECFEWDDTIAAHQFRLQQGRQLIVNIRPIFENKPTMFIHVPTATEKGEGSREGKYKPISIVSQNQFELALAKEEMTRHLLGLQSRLNALHQAGITAIDFAKANAGIALTKEALQ